MKVVFLDRDGVINENRRDHVKSWDEFVFLPGVLGTLRLLHESGWSTIVVTNQAIIDRKIVPRAVVDEINDRMVRVVAEHGGRIKDVLYCPHRPADGCSCRKPRPGLLLDAAARFNLRLEECYLVGDAFTDIAAGRVVGCHCALVLTGRGLQELSSPAAQQFAGYQVAPDLRAAVRWMVWMERTRTVQGQTVAPLL